MKIYKFGGASVKDAKGVKNILKVLSKLNHCNLILVISAMGKMTNAFEKIVESYFFNKNELENKMDFVIDFHSQILSELFPDKEHIIHDEINTYFLELREFLSQNQSIDYNYVYDQVVCVAELISTKICSAFLIDNSINNKWLDARKCIKTNSNNRNARVIWEDSCKQIKKEIGDSNFILTQGFIASDKRGNTTTLGREGSDYTAAIFAYCVQAEEVSIFKDVSGVLNADPKEFEETVLLQQISYKEAIEMAFFGASVIHPKTLQPLQRKNIPLFVKSFVNPEANGTVVGKGKSIQPKTPCYIVKKDQILLSISDKEFHFVMEDDISEIFDFLHRFKMKVNLIQNSAISFTVCVEDNFNNFSHLQENLGAKYKVLYNRNVTLYTIRHYTKSALNEIEKGKKILVKQLSRETAQIVVI